MSDKKQWYYFTFLYGSENRNRYVKFFGTYSEAREDLTIYSNCLIKEIAQVIAVLMKIRNTFGKDTNVVTNDGRMNEILYCIEERGNVIAKDLNMDNAMIFVRALFDTYFNEEDITFTIKRQKENSEVKE